MREPLAQGTNCTLAGSDASAVLRHTVQPTHDVAENIALGQGMYAGYCFMPVAVVNFWVFCRPFIPQGLRRGAGACMSIAIHGHSSPSCM